MKQEELTKYLYIKLRNRPICFHCGCCINKDDEIEYVRTTHFRGRVQYKFYHKKCFDFVQEVMT